jgi:hypothetical protein
MGNLVFCAVCDGPLDPADAEWICGNPYCDECAPEQDVDNLLDAFADEREAMREGMG